MISRPSTDQLILDCRRELLEVVRPAVADPAVQLAIDMLENVLRNAAVRAAHEIAWMHEEMADMVRYCRELLSAVADPAPLAAALAAFDALPPRPLHLDAVVAAYSAAGEAFSCALEAAIGSGDTEWHERGVALLRRRTDREQEIKGDWSMIGRG